MKQENHFQGHQEGKDSYMLDTSVLCGLNQELCQKCSWKMHKIEFFFSSGVFIKLSEGQFWIMLILSV